MQLNLSVLLRKIHFFVRLLQSSTGTSVYAQHFPQLRIVDFKDPKAPSEEPHV